VARQERKRVLAFAALGWAVPVITRLAVQSRYNEAAFWGALGSAVGDLFRPGYNLFLVGVFNAVPFVALIGLSRRTRRLLFADSDHVGHRIAVYTITVLLIVATGITSGSVWLNLFGPGRPSSTAVLAFVFIPLVLTVVLFGLYFAVPVFVALWRSVKGRRGQIFC